MFSTLNQTGWYINGQNFGVGGRRFIREQRPVEFNPSVPYMYVPDYDFQLFINQVKERIPEVECDFQNNNGKFNQNCDQV